MECGLGWINWSDYRANKSIENGSPTAIISSFETFHHHFPAFWVDVLCKGFFSSVHSLFNTFPWIFPRNPLTSLLCEVQTLLGILSELFTAEWSALKPSSLSMSASEIFHFIRTWNVACTAEIYRRIMYQSQKAITVKCTRRQRVQALKKVDAFHEFFLRRFKAQTFRAMNSSQCSRNKQPPNLHFLLFARAWNYKFP